MVAMKQPMMMTATINTQMNLNVDQICSLTAPCPPQDEQQRIAIQLDDSLAQTDELIVEAERAIELLQDRRTALISAAVTGQIDVRGFVPLEAA
jgi:type I restriction enzyme S subunit